jgi:hypothetical protein
VSWTRTHRRSAAAVAALALVPAAAVPALAGGSQKKPVKRPKDGATYSGHHPGVSLVISGKRIELITIRFPCHKGKGTTNLNDFPMRKTDKGWRFDIAAHGLVTYMNSEKHPDENAAIWIHGRFSRDAKTVAGRLRVDAPRCDTGRLLWSAKR